MDVPSQPDRSVSSIIRRGDMNSPPLDVALLMSQFWHHGQPKLQDQLPTV
jgi:hypothetical protein